jgi:hypothetical protein
MFGGHSTQRDVATTARVVLMPYAPLVHMTATGSGVSWVRPQPAGTKQGSAETEPILAVVRPVPHCRAAGAPEYTGLSGHGMIIVFAVKHVDHR